MCSMCVRQNEIMSIYAKVRRTNSMQNIMHGIVKPIKRATIIKFSFGSHFAFKYYFVLVAFWLNRAQ